MAQQWFYMDAGTQQGPVDDEGLARLVHESRVDGATLVWHQGLPEWRTLEQAQPDLLRGQKARPAVAAAPKVKTRHAVTTGLSGNEMYCLHQKGFSPGDIVVGNSVFSLGFVGGIGSALRTLAGGEVTQMTSIVQEGRRLAFERMVAEAKQKGGVGITGVSSELVQHAGNIEFLSVGSCLHNADGGPEEFRFSTSADGQELFCQLDVGFEPVRFVFGNVAYALGVGGGIAGWVRSLGRGEVKEYSQVFNQTRHLALSRIVADARNAGANAVVGIETSIIPFQGTQEMVMLGTASRHAGLPASANQEPVTSDLTNQEMWNLVHLGFAPVKLVLGVSVYSLGVVGGVFSKLQGLVRGEIAQMTSMIYDAREHALAQIRQDADACGADDVVGIKTYIYELGAGLIEFMAIGTAVKRVPGFTTASPQLPPQAVIIDKDTFVNTAESRLGTDLNKPGRSARK